MMELATLLSLLRASVRWAKGLQPVHYYFYGSRLFKKMLQFQNKTDTNLQAAPKLPFLTSFDKLEQSKAIIWTRNFGLEKVGDINVKFPRQFPFRYQTVCLGCLLFARDTGSSTHCRYKVMFCLISCICCTLSTSSDIFHRLSFYNVDIRVFFLISIEKN